MFVKATTFAALMATALAQTFSVSTPASLITCQPSLISWTGGTAPFILSVIPGGDVSAAALEYLESSTTSSSYTWTVNLVGGTYITFKVTDATGANVYSAPLTIQAGSSTSCMTTTGGSSSTEAGSSGTAAATDASTTESASTASTEVASSTEVANTTTVATTSATTSAAATTTTSQAVTTATSSTVKASSATVVSSKASTSAAASTTSAAGAMQTGISGVVAAGAIMALIL
ncbi:uncharacterized protein EHS24_003085 [Apiotrichum porosum]|uniref:Uncharacterized protein n=1 Tax=Apiotrichum porosum TaxID=105984 RepID=A0A427XF55_9TREE|nr:uncharacterized protein EHS24_003085 [Apiotrichum porosum]RSH77529.1 hypothetical protein EHS24_003085 [Apiotrichum porosum]